MFLRRMSPSKALNSFGGFGSTVQNLSFQAGAAHELVDGVAGVGAGPDDGGGFQDLGGAGADGDAPCPNPLCAPKPGGVEG